MKEQRRIQYDNKARYERKQKENLKQKVVLSSEIKDKISKLDPKGLIKFMQEEYNKITKREEGLDSHIYTAVIGRIEQLKRDWRAFHKQRFVDYIKKLGIKMNQDPKLSFKQNVMKLIDKNQYYPYLNISEEEVIVAFSYYRHLRVYTYYYFEETNQRLDYKIQFKRIAKDVTYFCETFDKLVHKINRIVGVQQYTYK